jgi:hypothetical protein
MRAAFAYALRRGAARLLLGLVAVGFVWTDLHAAWPWSQPSMKPEAQVHPFHALSLLDLPVAAGLFMLGLALAVLIYRRRPRRA